jgi:eukaryotic-like serine/threonine-protein kinase
MVSELQSGDPQTMGPYRLVGRLGAGGMGQVFLGLSPGGRPVAVKAIRAELAGDPEFRMRFGREVAAARKVSGVFTAMVVDADIDGPVAWLATAYVPGPSLAEAVDSHGPLPEGSVLALAAALAESLTAIHAAGVVHRDLKPSNVLLAEDGPRVIDFGISRAAEATALTRAGLVIGSPGFMSPEQAMGGDVGKPSDIFSLGAVLAFAATGEGPFGAGTTAALLYRVVTGTPDLDRVPATVRPLVERCLAKDPAQRPAAAGLLAEVGALQPAGDWLPDSLIRAFPRETAPGLALARPDPAPVTAAAPATPAWPGQTTIPAPAASAAARMPTRDSQPSAAAAGSLTATPGSPPPGDAPDPARPGGSDRPRPRRRRPVVLASVMGILTGASIAAFAMTSPSGHTPSSVQANVALTSAPMARASAGHTAPGASPSTDASQAESSPAVSSPASASPTASTPASASMLPSPTTSSPATRGTPTPPPTTSSPATRSTPTPPPTTPTPTAPSTPTPTPTAPSTPGSSPTPANTPPSSPASTPTNTSPAAPASTSP